MGDEIRVAVASYGGGRNLMMVYKDPITGKKVAKTRRRKRPAGEPSGRPQSGGDEHGRLRPQAG